MATKVKQITKDEADRLVGCHAGRPAAASRLIDRPFGIFVFFVATVFGI